MGITIHYKGKAKSLGAIDELIEEFKEIAETTGWNYGIVDEDVRGELSPHWGHGYGYIPNKEEIKKDGLEFFRKMVSPGCNGYFKIWDTKYAGDVRRVFRKGQRPKFFINTRKKGIWLDLHPKCELLEFIFDLNTLELANYETYNHSPGVIYGYNGLFCKTQFAGFKTHTLACLLIKRAEQYIDFSEIYDEANLYAERDLEKAEKNFTDMAAMIDSFGKILKSIGKELGVTVKTGGEL